MRLKENQVKQLCHKILTTLRSSRQIVLNKSEKEVLSAMEGIFLKELRVEDEINREASRLVEQYVSQAGGTIDREKMFQLVKKQLVKDRKIIL